MAEADFESKRKAMLKRLTQINRDKSIQRKVDTWKQKSMQLENQKKEHEDSGSQEKKCDAIIYGCESFFLKTIAQSLKNTISINSFDNDEKAIEYCTQHNITHILLDMDDPTDWKLSTNIFSAVKMLNPDVECILFTGEPHAHHVKTLEAQGAFVLTKPVNFNRLYAILK